MKKIILSAFSALVIGSIIFISCKPKNDNDAITPTYKDEATGTGGNPTITQVTTTGTISTTSVAMQNSSMSNVGIGGTWTSVGCSGQNCISVNNTSTGTSISVCFLNPPVAGTYALVSSQAQLTTTTTAFMTVSNPPSQPTGSTWYSNNGSITITITGGSITGSFSNVSCLQSGSSFPVVTVQGQVGCL